MSSPDEEAAVGESASVSPPGRWQDRDATTPPSGEAAGMRLGPYKLLQKLGEGGMGAVWMAEQAEPVQRRVAVKLIKAGLDSAQVIARFEAERQALALMDHPNIARVLDAGATPDGRPFVVMELVKGVPITAYCDQQQLSPRERLELFIPVCQAVQHAHQKGIIHRDLKPSNVLVALYDGRPVPKVIDFGVAKATGPRLTERTLFTEVGQVVGTLEYMSPEQAELNNLDIDTRADVYSLGVLLYELLTGSPPFSSAQLRQAGFAEVLRLIREVDPPRPSTKLSSSAELPAIAARRKLEPKRLARLVRGELDWITMKCLEKERGRRYETANGLALDIHRYLADEPVLAGPPSVSYRLRKYLRRHRGPVLAAALVLVALLAGLAGTTVGLMWAEQARAAEQEQRFLAERERDQKEEARKEAEGNAAEARRQEELANDRKRQAEANAREAWHQQHRAEEQKRETARQAAIVQATNDFLQKDLLGQADVGQQMFGQGLERDPDVKVRTLLDRAARAIEGKFADQPLTEAALRHTIGQTYWALGRYEQALPHLERAVRLRAAGLGADHLDTLISKTILAILHKDQGKFERAEKLYREVLQANAARYGDRHPETLKSKNNLAILYQDQGQLERAEKLFQEALRVQTATLGASHPDTASTKNNLTALYLHRGDFRRAEPLAQEVVRVLTAQRGADHPDTLTSKNNLALVYQKQEQYLRAEAILKEALASCAGKLEADHPITLLLEQNLLVGYLHQGRYDRAEPLCKELLRSLTARLGASHPKTLVCKLNLVALYENQGKYDPAELLLKEVVQAFTTSLGPDHPSTLTAKNNLAACYIEQRKFDRAEALFKEVLRATAARLGARHPETLLTKANLASLLQDQGKLERAETLGKEVVQECTASLGAEHLQTLRSKNALAVLYWRLKRLKESIPLFEEVLRAQVKQLGIDHPDALLTRANLGVNYRDAGRIKEAVPLLEEAWERAHKRPGGFPRSLAWIPAQLVDTYERAGLFAKSEPFYRSYLKQARKQLGADHPTTTAHMAVLGLNLLQQKKYAQAEALLRDCLAIRDKKQPELWTTFNTRSLLGAALAGQQRYADAEPLLLEGYHGMKERDKTIPPQAKAHLKEALERLVRLYDAWGKKDKADQWRKMLEPAGKPVPDGPGS
jgi:serine/threonine protein kinase